MVIVPDGAHVSAEVTLENKDIGFVEPGQDVTIKLETFPFTRYGTVPAQVETVTATRSTTRSAGPSSRRCCGWTRTTSPWTARTSASRPA